MSTPKKDWIFTAVLVVLIAVLVAVVAMHLYPSGSAQPSRPAATVTAGATPSSGEEAATSAPPGEETAYSADAAAVAGTETSYSATGETSPSAMAPRSPGRPIRVATARGGAASSPAGRPPRSSAAGRRAPAASSAVITSGGVVLASGDGSDPFPYLGLVNPFDPIVTPTPTPTPPPRPTPPENSLEKALKDWVLDYPIKHGTQFVFSDKVKKGESYTVEVGKPYHLKDVTDFDANVTANGRLGVQFEYNGHIKKFSMTDQ